MSAVLALAPTPGVRRSLTQAKVEKALRATGRKRYVQVSATRILTALRGAQLPAREGTDDAYGASVSALVAVITAMTGQIQALSEQVNDHFGQHPDAQILLSQPGLGPVLAARVLAEFGDDPDRYATAKTRRNYAGTSPITRASGKSRAVLARHVRNRRLADALDAQAFSALSVSPGARGYYDTRRATGASHHQALRAVSNRLVGILHGCQRHHRLYDEAIAWASAPASLSLAA